MEIAPVRQAPWVYAILLCLIGLVLATGGLELAILGGSLYYLITGIVVIVSAWLLWRGKRWGMWLYAIMLGYTLLWSLYETGFDGWSMMSRLGGPIVVGLYFLLPHTRRGLS